MSMTKPTSEQVTFLAAGTGAQQRTALDKMRETVSVKDFGAVGDGVADDTAAIQAALNADVPIWDDGKSIYRITAGLSVAHPKRLQMYGIRLRPDTFATVQAAISTNAQSAATTTLTGSASNYRIGRTVLTVASTSGMIEGQIVAIRSNQLWPYNNAGTIVKGETSRIYSVDSATQLTLAVPLFCGYDPSSETISVQAFNPIYVDIDGIEIVFPSGAYTAGNTHSALSITGAADCSIRNVRIQYAHVAGISINNCVNVQVVSPRISHCDYTSPATTQLGYATSFNNSTNCRVIGGMGYRNRKFFDTLGNSVSHMCGATACTVIGNNATGACMDTHGSANMTVFSDNTLISGNTSIASRGPNLVVKDNVFYMPSPGGVCVLMNGAPGLHATGNSVVKRAMNQGAGTDSGQGTFVQLSGSDSVLFSDNSISQYIICGNQFQGLKNFVRLSSGITTCKNLSLADNDIVLENNSGATSVSLVECATAVSPDHKSCYVSGNRIRASVGTYAKFDNGVFSSWSPVLTFETPGDLSVSYTTQLGWYERHGNMVTMYFEIVTASFSHTTASGALQVTGIPIPADTSSTGARLYQSALEFSGITKSGYTQFSAYPVGAATRVQFRASASASAISDVIASDVPTAGTVVLRGSITYQQAALTGTS